MTLNASLFSISCHLYPSRLPVKGWPWLFLLLFFCLDKKTEWEMQREHLFFFPFLFSAKGGRVIPVLTKVENDWDFWPNRERNRAFSHSFPLPSAKSERERGSSGQGLVRDYITSFFPYWFRPSERTTHNFFLLPVVAVGILLLCFSFPWVKVPLVL